MVNGDERFCAIFGRTSSCSWISECPCGDAEIKTNHYERIGITELEYHIQVIAVLRALKLPSVAGGFLEDRLGELYSLSPIFHPLALIFSHRSKDAYFSSLFK